MVPLTSICTVYYYYTLKLWVMHNVQGVSPRSMHRALIGYSLLLLSLLGTAHFTLQDLDSITGSDI